MSSHDIGCIGTAGTSPAVRVGRLVRVDSAGRCWIEDADDPSGSVLALLTATAASRLSTAPIGVRLLLAWDEQEEVPIIVDVIVPAITAESHSPPAPQSVCMTPYQISTDGNAVTIEAEEELTLQCGRARMTLNRNGRIALRGDYLVSYSRGTIKLTGAVVHIN